MDDPVTDPPYVIGKGRYEVRDGKAHLVMDVTVPGLPQLEATLEVPDELVRAWMSTERYSIDDGDDTQH